LLDHVEGGGARVFDQACALGVPSVTSRRRTSEYGKSWVEIPCPAKTNAEDAQDSEPVVQLPKWAQVSNPDRVLYPRQGIQKGDLAHYYHAVRDWMLPHLKGRPLTLVRCPQGHHRHCFFQKHHKKGTPDGIVPVSIVGEAEDFMAVANERGLLGLVQLGVLEVHVWGCHADRPNRPDRLVMDIDPDPSLPWNRLVAGAFVLREVLAELGLRSFVQTTGGKGLHVVFPIARRIDWNTAKEFCKAVADLVVRMEPDKYVANMAKAKRRGKIYIDYLRNAQGASAIASYSTRRHPHAPVATPISWDELSKGVQPSTFTVETVPRRVALLTEDPWPEYFELQQAVTAAARRKVKMG
jgi:bifunctional non-homologous end joining protein LigD